MAATRSRRPPGRCPPGGDGNRARAETLAIFPRVTDLALAAVGEELGFVGLLAVAAACSIAARGFRAALRAGNDYTFFLATAVTLFLTVPVLVMAAGMLGAIPLTGVVTPFLSYGGSAMLANFTALGILSVVGRDETGTTAMTPFRTPFVTWHRLWALLDSR